MRGAAKGREMRALVLFGLYALVFAVPLFVAAAWLLLVASQEVWVKAFGATVVTLGGLWNLWRGWTRLGRPSVHR